MGSMILIVFWSHCWNAVNNLAYFRKDLIVINSYLIDFFIVTPIEGVCNCSMFCCTLLYFHSSTAIILMGKRELIALLNLSSW